MVDNVDLKFFFNFRSPYCYLASKSMFDLVDDYHVNLIWRPLAGWDGRSAPDRAKVKVPITRQDVITLTALDSFVPHETCNQLCIEAQMRFSGHHMWG